MNLSTESELTSSSEVEFLSSTDPSELGLSEREIRKRMDPELMAPNFGPDSQLKEVKDLWGASACESLGNILHEFDDLFNETQGRPWSIYHRQAPGRHRARRSTISRRRTEDVS